VQTNTDAGLIKSIEFSAKATAYEAAGQKAMARIYRRFAQGWARSAS